MARRRARADRGAPLSGPVGLRVRSYPDERTGTTGPLFLLYPARGTPSATPFGRFTVGAVADGEPEGAGRRLVVVSHGNGSAPDVLRGLALDLARAGFVVALPAHVGNRLGDGELRGTADVLAVRPRQLRAAVDAAVSEMGPVLDPARVAVVGHSLGAYGALAAAGGRPWCAPWESPGGARQPVPVVPDPRVGAVVALAPAAAWFAAPGDLAGVTVPVLMLSATHDEHTPAWHGDLVARGVSGPLIHRVVQGAGHFAFLTPFGPDAVEAGLPPALDPPGFDRARALAVIHRDIARWLAEVLTR